MRNVRARREPRKVGCRTEEAGGLLSEQKDAGGSRTHLNRVAAGRLAVWLQRREWAANVASVCPMSSPGVEPGLRPSQGRVQIPHTPRTFGLLSDPPPGSRTRPCGFEDRRASATLAEITSSALARSRTWSTTFGESRAHPAHSKGRMENPILDSRGARIRTLCASFGGSLLSQEHTPVFDAPARWPPCRGGWTFFARDQAVTSADSRARNRSQLATRPL